MTKFIVVSPDRTDSVGPFNVRIEAEKAQAKLTRLVKRLAKKRKVGYEVGPWEIRQIRTTDEMTRALKGFYS